MKNKFKVKVGDKYCKLADFQFKTVPTVVMAEQIQLMYDVKRKQIGSPEIQTKFKCDPKLVTELFAPNSWLMEATDELQRKTADYEKWKQVAEISNSLATKKALEELFTPEEPQVKIPKRSKVYHTKKALIFDLTHLFSKGYYYQELPPVLERKAAEKMHMSLECLKMADITIRELVNGKDGMIANDVTFLELSKLAKGVRVIRKNGATKIKIEFTERGTRLADLLYGKGHLPVINTKFDPELVCGRKFVRFMERK
jgi:hypothetical protein